MNLAMLARIALMIWICLCALPAQAEQRLALIITNADYPVEIGRLAKTHDDGRIIATALKDVGFTDVRHVRDADFQKTRIELSNFVDRIVRAGPDAVIFFYYSGHGAADRTARGENYLIPVKAPIKTAKQLPLLGVGLGEIVKTLERVSAKARFVVIDACRNVAFTKGLKNAAKGFVPMRRLDGILLAFATRPGETAEDAGLYSRALAKHLRQPGIPPERVFKLTQLSVAETSKGNQVPWIEDGLLVRGFEFKRPEADQSKPSDNRITLLGQQNSSGSQAVRAIESLKRQPSATAAKCYGQRIKLASGDTVCIKAGSGKSFKDCDVCPEMLVVPAGSFMMGSNTGKVDEKPVRKIVIGASLAIGKFEVTFAEWDACVADGECSHRPGDNGWRRGKKPVINVSWVDINRQYLPWLSRKTDKTYRLLTEAEWEYAARGGSTTKYPWGNNFEHVKANAHDGDKTTDVGRFPPNSFGLHDLHGNVWEWVEDCYRNTYLGAPIDGSAMTLGNCQMRVLRGGAWNSYPIELRSTSRWRYHADWRLTSHGIMGFRVARDLAK